MTQPDNLIRDGDDCQRCGATGEIHRGRTCPDCDGEGVLWDDPWADDPHGDAEDRGHDRWVADELGAL
ncbi:Uncharacterised protein [Nocardia otitidiscaviarum]|uniref:Uncharacterized protein n=1 Tax=Nocardia otitidiscaviarum TaxID=1823 RepID=A0A378Y640_9NOCA|nr:hypothetical protein [Nocardia otitidiscaviarum]SUA72626.1 Uncharacterised protein [Nocardia otitidiscaviarum]SUA72686.1 Uncharacterised protein [Nocardia otitidiscaviarum]